MTDSKNLESLIRDATSKGYALVISQQTAWDINDIYDVSIWLSRYDMTRETTNSYHVYGRSNLLNAINIAVEGLEKHCIKEN